MSSALIILVTGILVSINLGLIGNFLVLEKKAMIMHAVSHSVLPGIIIGFVLSGGGVNLFTTLIASVISAFFSIILIAFLQNSKQIASDSAIAIIYTFMASISIFTISYFFPNSHIDLDVILLGHLEFVGFRYLEFNGINLGPESWWHLSILLIFNLSFIGLFYKELVTSVFDPEFSFLAGFRPKVLDIAFLTLVAINAVVCFSSVGILLTLSFTIIPTAAAYLLNGNLINMILTTFIFSIISSSAGYFLATSMDLPISASMASMLSVVFILVYCIIKIWDRFLKNTSLEK